MTSQQVFFHRIDGGFAFGQQRLAAFGQPRHQDAAVFGVFDTLDPPLANERGDGFRHRLWRNARLFEQLLKNDAEKKMTGS